MKILAVIDMQNDFIDGALGTPEAAAITERVRAKIDACLQNGDTVIYTRDTHHADYLETQEGRKLPVEHCIEGTHGWEIAEKVFVPGCEVIDKPSFGSLELAERMAQLLTEHSALKEQQGNAGGDLVEFVGLCTDICVISNAMIFKAKMPEIPVMVDASCCAGVTVQSHLNALEAMKMCQITVTGME